MVTEYTTIGEITGPLVLLTDVDHASYEELVEVELPSGEQRRGKVLEVNRDRVLVQLFEGTRGVDIATTKVRSPAKALNSLYLPISSGGYSTGSADRSMTGLRSSPI